MTFLYTPKYGPLNGESLVIKAARTANVYERIWNDIGMFVRHGELRRIRVSDIEPGTQSFDEALQALEAQE